MEGSEEEVDTITELVIFFIIQWDHSVLIAVDKLSKGALGARGDDTKSLKGAVLDCISKTRGHCSVLASTGQCYSIHSEGPPVEHCHSTIIVFLDYPSYLQHP